MKKSLKMPLTLFLLLFLTAVSTVQAFGQSSAVREAGEILQAAGIRGGIVVHIGCGDGSLTAALCAGDGFLVHGLDTAPANLVQARKHINSQGLYGPVSVDRLSSERLPYIDNLVNLVVSQDLGSVPMHEVMRVLCPEGVACIKADGRWVKTVKPRPDEIDDWTHYMHDASNNAVSHDKIVAPPDRLQWLGGPRYARHHDRMSSFNALVSAGARIFYIFDEGSRISILTPPQWKLIARDAFNGTILWKRAIGPWHSHLWPLKSGPAQIPRRLVAIGDRVYVTLSIAGPLTVLDGATGKTLKTHQGTDGVEEIIYSDGTLFLQIDPRGSAAEFVDHLKINQGYDGQYWNELPRRIMALNAETGKVLWTEESRVLPGTLAADGRRVVFHDGQSVVGLDRQSGDRLWRSEPVARTEKMLSFYVPILVLHDGVVMFSGGETAGQQTGSWYMTGKDTMTALCADTGQVLWSAHHPPSGYRSPEDMFIIDDMVWTGETTSGRAVGVFSGRDLRTGAVKVEFPPDVDPYWFHHRCYRAKATDNFLLVARTGTEFIDIKNKTWTPKHWFRGACLYGIMPANGLIYAPQHPCACYLEAKQSGFNALAPALKGPRVSSAAAGQARLERGPAYSRDMTAKPASSDWPTYRHDPARSGSTHAAIPSSLKPDWQRDVGGKLTSPVIAGGRAIVASVDAHTVYAFDAGSGKSLWRFTAGARVDSAPTLYQGRVLFGSADGWVYCLGAGDGELVWRFRAAPTDERTMAFEQLESVWPVPGNVLIRDGVLYCVAGRSMFMDGGLHLWRLDPITGKALSETVLDNHDPITGKELHDYVSWLNMPTALPDILSSDGKLIYMRSLALSLDGSPLPMKLFPRGADADAGAPPPTQYPDRAHLFSPTGFRDDNWWHRSYWMYGSTFYSGWCGYFTAGKAAPAGKMMVFDDKKVYGFGRKPQYFRWTTPIEHQLFSANKIMPGPTPRTGVAGSGASEFKVSHDWTNDLPVFARGMVLAGDTIFVAGPPDLIDEPKAFKQINNEDTQKALAVQDAAFAGAKGAMLLALSKSDGQMISQMEIDSMPVFDGLAAANGKLFLSATNGKLLCFGAK